MPKRKHDKTDGDIPEFTDLSEELKRRKYKPLYKFRICDVLKLKSYEDGERYMFNNYEVKKVTCVGQITEIFRDDNIIFDFKIDDGTGSICCFHRVKDHREPMLMEFMDKYEGRIRFFTNKSVTDKNTISQGSIVAPTTANNSVVKKSEKEADESNGEILEWYVKEVLNKEKIIRYGSFIKVVGFAFDKGVMRKIQVLEYSIIKKEANYKKLLAAIDNIRKLYK